MVKYTYGYKKGLYVNLTNRCVCSCVFCDKDRLQEAVGSDLALKKEPASHEVISEIRAMLAKKKYEELVFCGIGDALVRLDALLDVLKAVMKECPLPARLNTTGHAYGLYPGRDVARELKEAGLDTINISLNAADDTGYEAACRPVFKGSYANVLRFIQDCRDSGIRTIISFVQGTVDEKKARLLAKKLDVGIRIREKI